MGCAVSRLEVKTPPGQRTAVTMNGQTGVPTPKFNNSEEEHHDGKCCQATFVLGPLSHPVDLPGHGGRGGSRIPDSRCRGFHQPLPGGHDQHSHRHRTDPDDVSAAGQGEVRGTGRRVPQLESARAVADSELGRRADPDVLPGHPLPARLSRVHGGPDHDRAGPLHRHGDRLERAGQGRHGILCGPGGLQQHLSGAVLQPVCLDLHHGPAAAVRVEWKRRSR